ncbi:hypothetical protein [Phormidium nigroviride]
MLRTRGRREEGKKGIESRFPAIAPFLTAKKIAISYVLKLAIAKPIATTNTFLVPF